MVSALIAAPPVIVADSRRGRRAACAVVLIGCALWNLPQMPGQLFLIAAITATIVPMLVRPRPMIPPCADVFAIQSWFDAENRAKVSDAR